jgi:hypothetical protein
MRKKKMRKIKKLKNNSNIMIKKDKNIILRRIGTSL